MVKNMIFSYVSVPVSNLLFSQGPVGHSELNGTKYVVFPGLGGPPPEKKWGTTRKTLENLGFSWIPSVFYIFSSAGIFENVSQPYHVFNCTGVGLYPICFLQYFYKKYWFLNKMLGFNENSCF